MNKILLNIPETIETNRLILQMPTAGYGAKVHQAILDGYEDYIKFLNWSPVKPSVEMVEEDCRKQHAEFILRECMRYIIIEKHSAKVVGRCAFPPIQTHWNIPQFGISYFIRADSRNKGYASEAAAEMVKLAFTVLKAKKVEIYSDVENLMSIKVAEKLNFKHEFTQKGGWLRSNGELSELKIYSMFDLKELAGFDSSK